MKKFLILSLLVIVSGFFVTDIFAETYDVVFTEYASDPNCKETNSCVSPEKISIKTRDSIRLISECPSSNGCGTILGFKTENPDNEDKLPYIGQFYLQSGYSKEIIFENPGTFNIFAATHPWIEFSVSVTEYEDVNDVPYQRRDIELPTVYSETESTIKLGIDKTRYYNDQKISVFGELSYFVADEKVFLKIISPTQKIIFEKELTPVEKRFYDLVSVKELDLIESGKYTISVKYANENESLINFEFEKNTPETTKNETYYIATVNGKIPIEATLTNVDRLASAYFDQKANLRFTILADTSIQGTQTVTLEIPRNLLDSKNLDGEDIPFDVSYSTSTGDKVFLKTTDESKSDKRIISFSVEYDSSSQKLIVIEGTHSLGNRIFFEQEPNLENTLKINHSGIREGNFHIDSEGNIIFISGGKWMKFNNEGKLLVESKPEISLLNNFYSDSQDNLYIEGFREVGKNGIYKFSRDFKLLDEFPINSEKDTRAMLLGIDFQNNLWYQEIIIGESVGNCYKVSLNFEILDSIPSCDFIQTKSITDSKGNYYRNSGDIACKFSSDGNLLREVSLDGSVGIHHYDMNTSQKQSTCNSVSGMTRGIVLDSEDNLYLSFAYHIGIQKFSPELELKMILKPEFRDFLIGVDNSDQLYVVNPNREYIKIYSQIQNEQNQKDVSKLESEYNYTQENFKKQREEIDTEEKSISDKSTVQKKIASFVDESKDPQSYVDRYNNEEKYREWFDENYPQYDSIYQAVGLAEPVKEKVPAWVKNNAAWWAEGNIEDDTFVSGIQYLMKEKIVNIPDLPKQASEKARPSFVDETKDPQHYIDRYNDEPDYKDWFDHNYPDYTIEEAVGVLVPVPGWIKNTAGWWADGMISEDEFIKGIEYLVENRILNVN